ncbi:MAG: tetratricopeptide repeat protein, partial [Chloroflexi bacterium]|nr:tetratricopeptide repeat protein [Chloroflexota bacterium]
GDTNKALEFYKQALVIDREIGDKSGEAIDCVNIANCWLLLGETLKAIDLYRQGKNIVDDISFPVMQQSARHRLAEAYLFQNDLDNVKWIRKFRHEKGHN